uniref:Uncharacterized protein n=1 Tax=Oryzias latipes TaxID=8090 RepID=A0A3P9LYW0_ORYLA
MRNSHPESGWCFKNTRPTRGQCLPGQQALWGKSDLRDLPSGSVSRTRRGFVHLLCFFCRRDVFACIGLPDGDLSWEHSFARWPFGVCDYLVPVNRAFHPEQWAQRTRTIYKWKEPHNSFHPASWERVANEEMWQARMKTAFFLFDLAERMEGEARARLFELSYTVSFDLHLNCNLS